MRIHSILGIGRKRNSVSAVLTLGFFLTSCGGSTKTTLPTTWTIAVKTTPKKVKPDYEFTAAPDAAHNGCSFATASSGVYPASHLEVCSGDIIQWIGQSTGNSHEMVVFVSDQILQDVAGNTVATFPASNGGGTPKGKITTNPAAQRMDHEWFVMLFDKQGTEVHYDDPKIIIGK